MNIYDDQELIRLGDAYRDGSRREEESSSQIGATCLAKTKTVTTYPTSAGKFFACSTQKVIGPETEGGTATVADLGDTFYAWLPTGRTVPANGTLVICERVPYRWVID
jgi:hypothetical protein